MCLGSHWLCLRGWNKVCTLSLNLKMEVSNHFGTCSHPKRGKKGEGGWGGERGREGDGCNQEQ